MKLHWKPHEFAFLPPKERAMMYAFIDERAQEEERQSKKLKSKRGSHGRRTGRRR